VRSTANKLFELNQHCGWGGAGEVALIQRVSEALGGISVDQPLSVLRDQIANAIKQSVNILLELDFRTPFFQGNPEALLNLHPGDFVFAECRDQSVVLHVTAYGTPEYIFKPFAIGNGAPFAYALLQKYQSLKLDIEQASVVALKVIEEAIDVGAYGLGPPISIRHITSNGVDALDEARIAALTDAAQTLREEEIQLLVKNSSGQTNSKK
jgi:proteasome beta subunit